MKQLITPKQKSKSNDNKINDSFKELIQINIIQHKLSQTLFPASTMLDLALWLLMRLTWIGPTLLFK